MTAYKPSLNGPVSTQNPDPCRFLGNRRLSLCGTERVDSHTLYMYVCDLDLQAPVTGEGWQLAHA